jgi:hypothetical protein
LRKLSIVTGLTGLLLLSACDSAPAPANTANEPLAPAEAVPANQTVPAPAAPAAAAAPVLVGNGLRLAGKTLEFDTPRAQVTEALTKALGPPTELGENGECGGGGGLQYAEWKDQITLWFENESFIGWDSDGKLKTADGIALGSPRADLAALKGFEVEESTLGTEFSADGLGGILESKKPAAKITALWGGATCVFR